MASSSAQGSSSSQAPERDNAASERLASADAADWEDTAYRTLSCFAPFDRTPPLLGFGPTVEDLYSREPAIGNWAVWGRASDNRRVESAERSEAVPFETNIPKYLTPADDTDAERKEKARHCIFFARGYCRNGKQCKFLHARRPALKASRGTNGRGGSPSAHGGNEKRNAVPVAASTPVAPSHASDGGMTAAENSSVLSGGSSSSAPAAPEPDTMSTGSSPTSEICGMDGDSPEQDGNSAKGSRKVKKTRRSRKKPAKKRVKEELECGICFESPSTRGERFGLLSGCDHVFCFKCLKTWRKGSESGYHVVSREQARSCPLCRAVSYFVIPSFVVFSGEEKKAIVEQFKAECAKIPCKHFNRAAGCPFSFSCFYLHRRLDGSVVDKKEQEQRHSGKSGRYRVRISERNIYLRMAEDRQRRRDVVESVLRDCGLLRDPDNEDEVSNVRHMVAHVTGEQATPEAITVCVDSIMHARGEASGSASRQDP